MDGKPVERGDVTFFPADGPATETVYAYISQGNYTLKCTGGEKNVLIAGMATEEKIIPERYMNQSGLTANVSAENTVIDFELTAKPSRRSK
ncbi:hypothetical protein M4951_09115 [Blastopirellula sp. J2-11]|uniref:hypothetical protein n=1 Tax=Blastopirellula sp. J2-11 TaxID=2943192 RepID=UPI0021C92AE0|nr:hypothetical protein [Blastopirellula sp. J2-11]UUO08462.1 hypothetical protein M4951_09115 [Blastopirellula sp. J2-11]